MIRQAEIPSPVKESLPSLLPLLYADDLTSGWSAGMRAITHALLSNLTLPNGEVLEIGCGGGQLLSELQKRYPQHRVIGMDLHPLALAYTHSLLPNPRVSQPVSLVQSALPDLPLKDGQLALLLALDVFDQEGVDLDEAVAEAFRLLAPDGAMVIRVSAHPSLFGPHDLAFHTGQRYTRAQLQRTLLEEGFAIQRLTYANAFLSLPVAALRLAQRWGMLPWQPESYQRTSYHQAAAGLLHQEAKWLRQADLPWGLSLCAVARKP